MTIQHVGILVRKVGNDGQALECLLVDGRTVATLPVDPDGDSGAPYWQAFSKAHKIPIYEDAEWSSDEEEYLLYGIEFLPEAEKVQTSTVKLYTEEHSPCDDWTDSLRMFFGG